MHPETMQNVGQIKNSMATVYVSMLGGATLGGAHVGGAGGEVVDARRELVGRVAHPVHHVPAGGGCGLIVYGTGFRVWNVGSRVENLGLRIKD